MLEKYNLNSTKLLTQKDIILKTSIFLIGFLLILVQNWINPILILYPIVSFSFSLFFQIIESNKKITEIEDSIISYNPFGGENGNSNILTIFSYLQMLLIFTAGLDSLFHPQLVDNFFLFFLIPLVFLYGFEFFLLLIKVLNKAIIEIDLKNFKNQIKQNSKNKMNKDVISFIEINKFKRYSLYNLILFVIILIFTLGMSFLAFFNQILALPFYLPGTGIEGSQPVNISYGLYLSVIMPPIYTIWFLYQIYKNIIDFSHDSAEKVINVITDDSKKAVILNFLNFNKNN